jgi:hypothetical protein
VLAVYLDEWLDHACQPRSGDGLVVEARDAAPLGRQFADADERLLCPCHFEECLDARARGPVTDQGRVRARAHHEPERVDQQ